MIEEGIELWVGGDDGVIIFKYILEGRIAKEFGPFGRGNDVCCFVSAGDGGKLIIIYNMVLGCDGTSFQVEAEADGRGMARTGSHIHTSVRAGLPAGDGLAILYLLVEDIGRASEDMEVMKLVKRPSAPGEDIMRGEAGVGIRNMVKQEHCMLNGHGPQSWVSSVGPVDGGMEHHGAGNGHDGADSTLSPGIVVMGSNAGKPDDLVKLL